MDSKWDLWIAPFPPKAQGSLLKMRQKDQEPEVVDDSQATASSRHSRADAHRNSERLTEHQELRRLTPGEEEADMRSHSKSRSHFHVTTSEKKKISCL